MKRRAFLTLISSSVIGTAGCGGVDRENIDDPMIWAEFSSSNTYEMNITDYPKFEREFTHTTDNIAYALKVPEMKTEQAQRGYENVTGFSYSIEIISPEEKNITTKFLSADQFGETIEGGGIDELSRKNVSSIQDVYVSDLLNLPEVRPADEYHYLVFAPSTINNNEQVDLRLTAAVSPGAYARKPPAIRAINYRTPKSHLWATSVELVQDASPGAFKIYEGFDIESNNVIYRQRISSDQEKIDIPVDVIGALGSGAGSHMYTIEKDGKIERWSMRTPSRSFSVSSPEFNSRVGGVDDTNGLSKRTTVDGNTSITVELTNTGEAPIVIDQIKFARLLFEGDFAFETFGNYVLIDGGFIFPGETRDVELPGYSLPRTGEVDRVCDGTDRTAKLVISTKRGDTAEYEITFSLDTPSRRVKLYDSYDGEQRYACHSGNISDITRVNQNS